MKEIWKPIKHYESFYHVSNLGRVKSIERVIIRSDNKPHPIKERILTPWDTCGYCSVRLSDGKSRKVKLVHQIVAEAFLDNPNNYTEVNHIDGNKKNNSVSNLEWTSHSDNCKHAAKTGLRSDTKMNIELANAIREEYATTKTTHRKLGEKYGVSHSLIGFILRGKIW